MHVKKLNDSFEEKSTKFKKKRINVNVKPIESGMVERWLWVRSSEVTWSHSPISPGTSLMSLHERSTRTSCFNFPALIVSFKKLCKTLYIFFSLIITFVQKSDLIILCFSKSLLFVYYTLLFIKFSKMK